MGALLTGGRSILPQGIQLGALAGALVGIQGALLTCFDRKVVVCLEREEALVAHHGVLLNR